MAVERIVQWVVGYSTMVSIQREYFTSQSAILYLVEFDDYRGPSAVHNEGRCIVPIVPETIQFDPRCGKSGNRGQFPLVLGWAITIHKSQGLTLERAIVGIGSKENQIGLTYVGCSRVKSCDSLAFYNSFPW